MLARLVLLFAVVPLVELFLLLRVAEAIAVLPTIGLVLGTGALGAWLVRRQGMRTLQLIRQDMAAGRMPAEQILSGVLILIGGAFLVTPGILTDAVGFLLMVPGNRRWVGRWLRQRLERNLRAGRSEAVFSRVSAPGMGMGGAAPGAGEVRDVTDEAEVHDAAPQEPPRDQPSDSML